MNKKYINQVESCLLMTQETGALDVSYSVSNLILVRQGVVHSMNTLLSKLLLFSLRRGINWLVSAS